MKKKISIRLISVVLSVCMLLLMFSGCDISSKHVEISYGENDNSDIKGWDDIDNASIQDWDNGNITLWSDVDDYSNWVYSELMFDDITDQMPIVECRVLDYKTNGKYFDGDKVYKLVGDKFDVNSFVAKYAIGTGVIVICVIMTVATAGSSSTIACFICGALDGSVSMAAKGAAFGAATKAITTAIKTKDFEESLYGALEGSADGYMWGAIFGAATGGFNSKYCFTGDTLVQTDGGLKPISELCVGECVYSYDEESGAEAYKTITQVNIGKTDTLVYVCIEDGETIKATPTHPFLTSKGWKNASELSTGDRVLSSCGSYQTILSTRCENIDAPVDVYSLCIDDYHTFAVGNAGIIGHNKCKPNEKYANDTYKFPEGTAQAVKYPNGVPFNADGYPIFDQYAAKTVKFEFPSLEAKASGKCLVGNCTSDFKLANELAGLQSTPAGYTWHHCEDMMTMQLVPQDVHSVVFGGVAHAGGESALEAFWALLETVTP